MSVHLQINKVSRQVYHPITTLVKFIPLYVYLHPASSIIILRLKSLSKCIEPLNGVWFQKVLIIEMVEKNVEALLSIFDLCRERRRSLARNPLHVGVEN